jgi:hypothetical protein
MMRISTFLTALPLLATLAPAQHTILFLAGTSDRHTIALDPAEVDLMRSDEIYELTPTVGQMAIARPFLPVSLQWHYVGDLTPDGQYVEDDIEGPGDTLDAVFIKAGTVAPVTPRDVFFSLTATSADLPGVRVSDVLRFSAQGVQEFFLTHALFNSACGLASTATTVNLDAICQSAAGDIFFSQSGLTTINGAATDDGDILVIPSSAITYDVNGNVSAVIAGTATRVAGQADLITWILNSGHRTSVGGLVTTSFELSGLEVDPNGGTFVSPVNGLSYANLLFCWSDFHNDGAIISSAAGGSIAVINGVPMASTTATLGDQIGILPDSTGTFGPNGFALIPQGLPSYSMVNFPRNQFPGGTTTQALLQNQISGGTPGGFSIVVWSIESAVSGGAFPAAPAGSPFVGEFGISMPNIIGAYVNDSLGYAQTDLFLIDAAAASGVNLACQALDVSTFRLSTPSAVTFF